MINRSLECGLLISEIMPIVRITSHGLITIAILVAALWGCILAEDSIVQSARLTGLQSLSELRSMRNGLRKVSTPDVNRHLARQSPC